jgi:uncharacterized protein YjbJ (UPF0337 family)
MNAQRLKGQWKQVAGRVKTRWGKLTDDEMTIAAGNKEYLEGKLEENYGLARWIRPGNR